MLINSYLASTLEEYAVSQTRRAMCKYRDPAYHLIVNLMTKIHIFPVKSGNSPILCACSGVTNHDAVQKEQSHCRTAMRKVQTCAA